MRVLDHITTRLDRFSVWLRWRWNRSHYEVSAVLLIVSAAMLVSIRPAIWSLWLILLLFAVLLIMAVYRAHQHNKPAAVGYWNFLSDIALMFQLAVMVWHIVASIIHLDPMRFIASISAPMAFILLDFPGRKVDYEPPAKGSFAMQGGS